MTRREFYAQLRSAAYFAAGSIVIALAGDPQPFAIITAGLGGLTAGVIALRAIEARAEHLRRQGRGGWAE